MKHKEKVKMMTNKEAIELLKPLTEYSVNKNGFGTFPMVSTPLQVEALELAIKALRRVDCIYVKDECNFSCGESGTCEAEEEGETNG